MDIYLGKGGGGPYNGPQYLYGGYVWRLIFCGMEAFQLFLGIGLKDLGVTVNLKSETPTNAEGPSTQYLSTWDLNFHCKDYGTGFGEVYDVASCMI